MICRRSMVETLGYIGGQDGGLGGYCEPLIIRVGGKEHYVLHEMHTYRDLEDGEGVKGIHNKVEFASLEELTSAFDGVRERLGIDHSLPWVETDENCGYDIPKEEWENH